MKFLIDVCTGRSLAEWLRSKGYDVVEVRERNCKMSDEEILAWAVKENRILITMDKDFSELIVFLNKKHTGMIRLENLPSNLRIKYLKEILDLHKKDLEEKAIVIQKGNKIRILRY